jgi:ABC-type branched-subunit amino acid transport system substrate-binding protein
VRVALLLPLSGPSASIGNALLDAAQMAIFDVGDERLTLLPRDTGGTPEGAAKAAQAALSEGAELILGPLFATSVRTVAPLARERGVNVVAFSTDTSVAGGGTFLMGFTPDQQVDRVVEFALRQGLIRFATLAPDTAYGRAVAKALRRSLDQRGGGLVQTVFYDPAAEDISPIVRGLAEYDQRRSALVSQKRSLEGRSDSISANALKRLQQRDTLGDLSFEAIMLPEGGARLKAIAPLLPFYDIDTTKIRLLGTGLWDEPNMGSEPALVGGWFAGPPPATADAFQDRFQTTYGKNPPRIASLAYDAVALAAVLARDEGGARFSKDAIGADSGFAGFDGIFRFGPDGVAERGLAVIQVEAKGISVVDPAPESFEAFTN